MKLTFRKRWLAITAAASTLAGIAPATPAFAAYSSHHLIINKQGGIGSYWFSTKDNFGDSFTGCIPITQWQTGWVDGHRGFLDGEPTTIITFYSINCTSDYAVHKDLTTPMPDGRTNWWLDMR